MNILKEMLFILIAKSKQTPQAYRARCERVFTDISRLSAHRQLGLVAVYIGNYYIENSAHEVSDCLYIFMI